MSWVRYDDAFHRHPKVMAVKAEDPAAIALHVLCGTASAATSRPGVVTWGSAFGEAAGSRAKARRWADLLTRHDLWHVTGHDCESCPQPGENEWVIHDWDTYNSAVGLSRKRSEAGKKGAAVRWQRDGKRHAVASDNTHGSDSSRTPLLPSVAAAPEPLPPPLLDLRQRLEAVRLTVRWDRLAADQVTELLELLETHGPARLVKNAQAQWQKDNPPAWAQAWIGGWQQLPTLAPAKRGKCPDHDVELPCNSCAADAKAAS
jgi:hypothetical protein